MEILRNTKPHALTLVLGFDNQSAVCVGQNQTKETFAERCRVSRPTSSGIITRIETALPEILRPVVPTIPQTLLNTSPTGTLVLEAPLVPTYQW